MKVLVGQVAMLTDEGATALEPDPSSVGHELWQQLLRHRRRRKGSLIVVSSAARRALSLRPISSFIRFHQRSTLWKGILALRVLCCARAPTLVAYDAGDDHVLINEHILL